MPPGKLQLITHLSEYVWGDLVTVYNTNTSYVIYMYANFNGNKQSKYAAPSVTIGPELAVLNIK